MSLLAVGISHHTAPLDVLERVALDAAGTRELATALGRAEHVREVAVLATCNRLEVYADVTTFHGGLADIGRMLVARAGLDLAELTPHLYVRYAEHAVQHLFRVAAGLDSMALGESQVLGQVRATLRRAQEDGTLGRLLDPLLQHSLRAGKRAHTETGLDRAGHSLVEAALAHADEVGLPLTASRALVVGAGAMSGLAAATLYRGGAAAITVANRTPERAQRLARAVGGEWLALDDPDALVQALAGADVVVSCTGAVGHVLTVERVAAARELRAARAALEGRDPADQLLVDLALPRDVEPGVTALPGVHVVDLATLGRELEHAEVGEQVEAARRVVDEEVATYLQGQRADEVAPTVVALRSYARQVVEAELARLRSRLGEVDPKVAAEVELSVHRVVEKILHTPTVRVKSLAAEQDGSGTHYAAALRELFDLDIDAVTGGATITDVSDVLAAVPGERLGGAS
ncbi:glutamyl-tRNA reductase [Angustibacter speluncae]